MEMNELRRRVGAILAAEEREQADWPEVECLTDVLQGQLRAEPNAEWPEIVNHYLDDADIRARDGAYAIQQRQEVRRFVETGEFDEGAPIPSWACALTLAVVAGLIVWLVM